MNEQKRSEDQQPQAPVAEPGAEPASKRDEKAGLRIKSGLRSGDVYLQYPKGSNNRLDG